MAILSVSQNYHPTHPKTFYIDPKNLSIEILVLGILALHPSLGPNDKTLALGLQKRNIKLEGGKINSPIDKIG
jgi:hypothetical protein